jgi:hypothetical protein
MERALHIEPNLDPPSPTQRASLPAMLHLLAGAGLPRTAGFAVCYTLRSERHRMLNGIPSAPTNESMLTDLGCNRKFERVSANEFEVIKPNVQS